MDTTSLIIQLVSGAVGGNIAGALLRSASLGVVGNSVVGILGGGLGGGLMALLSHSGTETAATAASSTDLTSILTNVGVGGVGGVILLYAVAAIRKQLGNQG